MGGPVLGPVKVLISEKTGTAVSKFHGHFASPSGRSSYSSIGTKTTTLYYSLHGLGWVSVPPDTFRWSEPELSQFGFFGLFGPSPPFAAVISLPSWPTNLSFFTLQPYLLWPSNGRTSLSLSRVISNPLIVHNCAKRIKVRL